MSGDLLLILKKAVNFAFPTILVIGVGLAVAEVLVETGIIMKISKIGRPLSRFAGLPDACGFAIITATVSFVAANSMLQDMRENKILTDRETFLASLLAGSIAPVKELFTYHLPVILPALGLYAGSVYMGTLWLGSVALLLFVMIAGRILLKNQHQRCDINLNFQNSTLPSHSRWSAVRRFFIRFGRIGGIFLTVTVTVFLLMELGVMARIEGFLMPLASYFSLPAAVLPAVAAYIASPLVGITMMGSILRQQIITDHQAIIALLFGSIFMLPVLYLRFYFPQWISIFGLRLGIIRGVTSAILTMCVRIAVLIVFMCIQ
ncbi:MAG: hypothetical protein WHS38_04675 [Thermodesulforhabdaceae bacterium]